jgi:hypothetical protein
MILPLKTNAYAPELMSILDLVEALIDHLATCDGPVLSGADLEAAAACAKLPDAVQLLEGLRAYVETLLRRTTPADRALLAAAIKNDRRFDQNVDSNSYRLQYPGLSARIREHATPLLVAFYERVRSRGIAVLSEGGDELMINREMLERGFFERNAGIRACPVCMEAEIALSAEGAASTTDCDHYLPKYLYGPLAVHPQNLVFICLLCNQRRKGRRDPLTGLGANAARARRIAAGALRTSYLPYRRPALPELKVTFTREGVTLGAETPSACERVANLDRVFGLARAWGEVLPRAEREMFEELKAPPTKKAVKAILMDTEQRGQGPSEHLKQGVYLRSRYATHLREDCLGALTSEWRRKAKELRLSASLYDAS